MIAVLLTLALVAMAALLARAGAVRVERAAATARRLEPQRWSASAADLRHATAELRDAVTDRQRR